MRAYWWISVLAITACGDKEPGTEAEADTDTDTDTDSDTDTDTDSDTDTDTGEDLPRTDVSGQIFDGSGAAFEGAQIRFCRGELCLNGTSDAQGSFSFEGVEAAPHSFEVLVPSDPTRATGFAAVTLEEGVPRTLEMHLPTLDAPSALGPTEEWHTVGAGLRIALDDDDLETPLFLPDATEVAGVLVDPANHPPLDGLTGVHAVWFTSPFDYHAPAGIPVEIDNNFGLAAGGTYQVWVGDYASSTWLDAGTLTESGGVLTGTARLPLMSTVVLADVP